MRIADFKNKKVLIMGLGLHGGGAGAAAFFARLGRRVIVTDLKSRRELTPSIQKLLRFHNIIYHLDGHRPDDFKTVDYIIKGPGVPQSSRFLKIAKRAGIPILSDVEIFFQICPAPIIGITGTKGKSTVASLLFELLGTRIGRGSGAARYVRPSRIERGSRIWLAGNIRKSVLDILPRIRTVDLVVLELSSFHLDSLKNSRISPHIAIITNIFPDHLNRYSGMETYAESKANIFRFQKPGDWLFINAHDARLARLSRGSLSRVVLITPEKILRRFKKSIIKAIPDYHWPNIALAVACARHLGVGDGIIRKVLSRFHGIPSRMELVRKLRGIEFINDTTATNPGAAEEAVLSTKKRIGSHGLHVIAGGYDKKLPIKNFIQTLLRNAASIIFLPGTATNKMKSQITNHKSQIPRRKAPGSRPLGLGTNPKSKIPNIFDAKSMNEAIRVAFQNSKPGDVVLLSPGAASFGLFRHEFDRGEKFVKAVKSLRP